MRFLCFFAWTLVFPIFLTSTVAARQPVVIDTDIGSWVDDAFAISLALASHEIEVQAITTCAAQSEDRAWIVCRLLTHLKQQEIPVAFGRGAQANYPIDGQIQYRRHPAVVWNRTAKPVKQTAVELLYEKLRASPGKVRIVCLGPLTNIAQLLTTHPDAVKLMKDIVVMGGAISPGERSELLPPAEWNFQSDVAAAQTVLASGAPLLLAPLDSTVDLKLNEERLRKLFDRGSMLTYQLQALYELWNRDTPTLFDCLPIVLIVDDSVVFWKDYSLTIDKQGRTLVNQQGKPNAHTAISLKNSDGVLDWITKRLIGHGESQRPQPPQNRSQVIERLGLPELVHTFEDYETDIEKRWWLTGKLQLGDTPPGSRRACRAVITQDYDARQGNLDTAYRAVIFNPVPGPPMGSKTRLSFRYKIRGTDVLRVQLFSLSNGYHRYLSLSDLPQNEWQEATVDMTQMRRPDGSGGPLAENERIDDIQFYIDPRAELLIDDIVLYEEGQEKERPYPKRILFSGWFDTGKQGKEWPGQFEILPHQKPRTWKYARSIEEDGAPVLRINLRGKRRLEELLRLRFDGKLAQPGRIDIELVNTTTKERFSAVSSIELASEWSRAYVDLKIPSGEEKWADEIQFIPKAGQVLEVDNVLLYQPDE